MKFIFLGTGTSHGIPVIGCQCRVCRSNQRQDQRTRSSAIIQANGINLLIDAGPELRLQLLREKIDHLDAMLLTHDHADHIAGLDDLRIFSERSQQPFIIYGPRNALRSIRKRFDYVFRQTQAGGGKPKLKLIAVQNSFVHRELKITPLPVWHGRLRVLGYRIGQLAYVTDVSSIPNETLKLMRKLDLLVLDALRPNPHPTHFSLEQARAAAKLIAAKRTLFTHVCHLLSHRETNRHLPANMKLAYDGLKVTLRDD